MSWLILKVEWTVDLSIYEGLAAGLRLILKSDLVLRRGGQGTAGIKLRPIH
jgi:hypothetical protein